MGMYSANKPSGFKSRPTSEDKTKELMIQVEELKRKIEDLEQNNNNLNSTISDLRKHRQATEKAIKLMASAHEKEISSLSQEIEELKNALGMNR